VPRPAALQFLLADWHRQARQVIWTDIPGRIDRIDFRCRAP
jgi:hypothetical protein